MKRWAMTIPICLMTSVAVVYVYTLRFSTDAEIAEAKRNDRMQAEEMFLKRANTTVMNGRVVKRPDGICVLYTETNIGAVGSLPLIINVPCQ